MAPGIPWSNEILDEMLEEIECFGDLLVDFALPPGVGCERAQVRLNGFKRTYKKKVDHELILTILYYDGDLKTRCIFTNRNPLTEPA